MTILFTTDNYLPATNGVVTQVKAIKEELERRGHRVIVVAPKYGKHPPEVDVFRLASTGMPQRPGDRLVFPFNKRVEMELLKMPIDIFHNHLGLTGLLGKRIAIRKRLPKVATLHTLFSQVGHWIFPQLAFAVDPIADYVARAAFKNYDMIIAPSQRAADSLVKAKVKSPTKIIPNGINLDVFKKASGEMFRREFAIDRKKRLLVIVGKLDPGKNVDLAILAIERIRGEVPDVQLAIIGDGILRDKLQGLIDRLNLNDIVIITGFLEYQMVASAYAAAEIALMLSDIDTFSAVLIEAAASGRPIIALKDKSATEIVKDGKNGILTVKEPRAVAKAIIKLLENPKLLRQYGKANLKIAESFSIKGYVDQLEALYKELIKSKK